jgi:hypothetical protein
MKFVFPMHLATRFALIIIGARLIYFGIMCQ